MQPKNDSTLFSPTPSVISSAISNSTDGSGRDVILDDGKKLFVFAHVVNHPNNDNDEQSEQETEASTAGADNNANANKNLNYSALGPAEYHSAIGGACEDTRDV